MNHKGLKTLSRLGAPRCSLWISIVCLMSLGAALAGWRAKPFIAKCEKDSLPVLDPDGYPRYQATHVEVVPSLMALESRASWTEADHGLSVSVKWLLLVLSGCALAVIARRSSWKRGVCATTALLVASAISVTWEEASRRLGLGWPNGDEVLVFRSLFSSYKDGYSEPYSIADVYVVMSCALVLVVAFRAACPGLSAWRTRLRVDSWL